jgi:small-conductance mechanosensitive channel
VVIKVGVAYESDADQVRQVLVDIAKAHPQIVQTPPPNALLVAFGENALEFELRCIVTNVESGSSVKSDLHFAILKGFREAGIRIPYPKVDPQTHGDAAAMKPRPARGAAA